MKSTLRGIRMNNAYSINIQIVMIDALPKQAFLKKIPQ